MKFNNQSCVCLNNNNESISNSTNKIFNATGKANTSYILNNPTKKIVFKYIVDDCLLVNSERESKCDYLFIHTDDIINYATFIEMKGADLIKAINQINSSINILERQLKGYKFKGRIIATKVYNPDIKTSAYKNLKKRLNDDLKIKSKQLTDLI